MAFADLAAVRPVVAWHHAGLDEWNALSPRTQSRAKVGLLLAVTGLAFHYSLSSLLQTVGLDTPLAYVGLVPFLALGLAWLARSPLRPEPPIHDRQLDYTIGLPLVLVPVLAAVVLPGRMGAMYWVNRVDLLFLPLFVAGATILLFGARVAWRQKVALAYLFLAWPWPYTTLLLGAMNGFTSVTLAGLGAALRVLPLAVPVAGAGNEGMFQVVHAGRAFPVSVVSACSGVDGMVGFLLIGVAFAAIVRGPRLRKALWLLSGLIVLWSMNLLRLLLIFGIGRAFGPHLALDIVHPVAGVVMFSIGVVLITLSLRRFGLGVHATGARTLPIGAGDYPGGRSGPALHAAQLVPVVALFVVSAVALSVANSGLRAFDPVAGAAGEPRLGSFLAQPATPAGWTPSFQSELTVNKPLFGQSSRWFRYLYSPTSPGRSSLHSTLPVTADVINAGSLTGFNTYGVTACYSFHGYTLRDVARVDLGQGLSGQALSFTGGNSHQDWSIVYWLWPVQTGGGTRYERVILYLQNTAAASVRVSGGAATGRSTADPVARRLENNRAFLVAFARQVIVRQAAQRDTGVAIASVPVPGAVQAAWALQAKGGSRALREHLAKGVGPDVHGLFWLRYFQKHPRPQNAPAPGAGQPATPTGRS